MKKTISIIAILLFAFSCSGKVIDVKSPCVSTEDGPCGKKRSINNWWINNSSVKQQLNS